ncbi:helix-turn-helix domain-containing protein [Paenibacillus sonchi]|uniref:helix-turn-helix domain-containing protein n=1 Tax=Paenibacillus sonchi TaxID=373687 RepID=UPI001E3A7925|nr:helix-turn-helix domain-containing protein [Paenibacillus sonchi]
MTALEKAIADIVAVYVTEAEMRIMERLSAATDRTLTVPEACDYLSMSDYTLRQLCKAKRIPHRTVGADGSKNPRYLFSTVSLDRWMREEEARNYIQKGATQ